MAKPQPPMETELVGNDQVLTQVQRCSVESGVFKPVFDTTT